MRWLGRSSSCTSAAITMPADAPEHRLMQATPMTPNKSSAPRPRGKLLMKPYEDKLKITPNRDPNAKRTG